MPERKKITTLLAKVSCLKQRDEIWEGTSRLGRYWITPENKPSYRPYMMLFTRPSGAILCNEVLATPPTADQMFEQLLKAMRRPLLGAGRPGRPKIVYLDSSEHVAELAPRLTALEIDCEYRSHLPVLELNLTALEERINQGREPIPGLLSVPTVTPPLVQHLYELAADFYRAQPWRWLSDLHPIEICYPIKANGTIRWCSTLTKRWR